MSESHTHSPLEIAKHNKLYVIVFVALLVGTVITVALNAVHFDSFVVTVSVALFVAVVKAFLVAGYFMHLISEKTAIYAVLAATVFFLIGMMVLTMWSLHDFPAHTANGGDHLAAPALKAH
ncbi:MAG: cytochrome C oxidase subunit IV family protein [Verrucomicrobia bacterium]|nr:cytochrome C oxidase subunit IV family protein [Verrucomicrobiota bacterium]